MQRAEQQYKHDMRYEKPCIEDKSYEGKFLTFIKIYCCHNISIITCRVRCDKRKSAVALTKS